MMRIGVLGAGRMAEALAGRWCRAGYDVLVGARDPQKAQEVAKRIGARSGSLADAADFGDALLLAVSLSGVDATLDAGGPALSGKALLDCTNAIDTSTFTTVRYEEGSLAAHVASVSGAHVAKAFNLSHFHVWRDAPRYGGLPLNVPMAGHDMAKDTAAELIAATGAQAVDVGDLVHAGLIEAMAGLVIRMLFGGADATTAFQLMTAD
jgi:hypothetical protein